MPALRDYFSPVKAGGVYYDGAVVGVEIEVEGENLPQEAQGFRCERDGSLRGESMEYVFSKPVPWEKGYQLCKILALKMKQKGSEIYNTGYAGIHVHVNVSDMTPVQLWRYAIAYYVVENLLLEWCGEDRRTNLFCLGLPDAPLPLKRLRHALSKADFNSLCTDDIRYSALNFKALSEYGSFEFRSMRSTLDVGEISKWVEMLLELRQFALTDYPVRNMVNDLSVKQDGFLEVLMPTTHKYLDDIPFKFERMLEGVREVQFDVFAFCEENANKIADAYAEKIKQHKQHIERVKEGLARPAEPPRKIPVPPRNWFEPEELVWQEFDGLDQVRKQHEPEIDQ